MAKYYVYQCAVSEIDDETQEVTTLLKLNVKESKLHTAKNSAFCELRDIIAMHCKDDD